MSSVDISSQDRVRVVTINRPSRRNAVDGATARALSTALREFDADDTVSVAVLTGAGGHFCAGADLKLSPLERSARWDPTATDRWARFG